MQPLISSFIQLSEDLRNSEGPIENINFKNNAISLINESDKNRLYTFQDANEFLSLFLNKLNLFD